MFSHGQSVNQSDRKASYRGASAPKNYVSFTSYHQQVTVDPDDLYLKAEFQISTFFLYLNFCQSMIKKIHTPCNTLGSSIK